MRDHGLTGLRVVAATPDGPASGVARVRYDHGHQHAGHYEVERADGTSFLAPVDTCTPGPNWDETPEEGRFTGAEFFLPAFLDGTRRRFLSAGPGVVVPGDMEQLRELADRIEPGWTVRWVSHNANEFRGTVEIDAVDDKGFSITGPKDGPRRYDWPKVVEYGPQFAQEFDAGGDKLVIVRVHRRRTGKAASVSRELTFQPGSIY